MLNKNARFSQHAGLGKAHQRFGDELNTIIEELNEKSAARTERNVYWPVRYGRNSPLQTCASRILHFLWKTGCYLHSLEKHVNQASISSKTLANSVPFISPPLDQQKHNVTEIEKQLSRLDEAVANIKHVEANPKRYKAAVEGRLVAEVDRRLSLLCKTETQVDVNLKRANRMRQLILGSAFSLGLGVHK